MNNLPNQMQQNVLMQQNALRRLANMLAGPQGVRTRHNGFVTTMDYRKAKNLEEFFAMLKNSLDKQETVGTIEDFLYRLENGEQSINLFRMVNAWPQSDDVLNPISPVQISDICENLKASSTILNLTIEGWKMDDGHMRQLSDAIRENRNLGVLRLRSCGISDQGVSFLADALQENKNLMVLILDKNQIGDQGAIALADMLRTNQCLTLLRLNLNFVTSEGSSELWSAMKVNSYVCSLEVKEQRQRDDPTKGTNIPFYHAPLISMYTARNATSRSLASNEKAPWRRSKLMVVGQGRSGKSATIRSLLKQSYDPNLPSTVGASVSHTGTSHQENYWREPIVRQEAEFKYLTSHVATIAGNRYAGNTSKKNARKSARVGKRNSKSNRKSVHKSQGVANLVVPEIVSGMVKKDVRSDAIVEKSTQQTENTNGGILSKFYKLTDLFFADDEEDQVLMTEEEIQDSFDYNLVPQGGDSLELSIWDYAGQRVFYGLHQLFMTGHGVYMLVFDMRQVLENTPECLSTIRFWIKSIRLHANEAPVLLVGTFLDAILEEPGDPNQKKRRIEEILQEMLSSNISVVIKNNEEDLSYFPISNRNPDGADITIRNAVEKAANEQAMIHNEVSLKWLKCLDMITETAVKRDTSFLTLADVEELAQSVGITSSEEITTMLLLFNELGVLIYFTATEKLRNIITVKPSWLVDAVSKIVRDEQFHSYSKEELEKLEDVRLLEDSKRLFAEGLASRDLVEFLWDNNGTDILLELLQETMLLSEWGHEVENGNDKYYLVPSLLKDRKIESDSSRSSICIFDFSENFLPFGLFERLICLSSKAQSGSYTPVLSRSMAKLCFSDNPDDWFTVENVTDLDQLRIAVPDNIDASKYVSIFRAMINRIDQESMSRGLKFKVQFVHEGKELTFKEASETNLSPWFSSQRNNDSTNSDFIDVEAFE